MDWLIWGGAVVSVLGIIGLLVSVIRVASARKRNLSDEELRIEIRKAIPLNLGALFMSAMGLMAVIVGIMLG